MTKLSYYVQLTYSKPGVSQETLLHLVFMSHKFLLVR